MKLLFIMVTALLWVKFFVFWTKRNCNKKFDPSNIEKSIQNLSLKKGDVIVYGVKGMTREQFRNTVDMICKFMPEGVFLFTDFDGIGFMGVRTD